LGKRGTDRKKEEIFSDVKEKFKGERRILTRGKAVGGKGGA